MSGRGKQRGTVVKIALAVLGGWLAIMPAAVLTIALRMREFDPSGLPSQYSAILATGWLVLIASLIAFGSVGDALERQGRSRAVLVRIALPILVLLGYGLALAETPWQLGALWAVLQIPAAAIITSALALSGDVIDVNRRGILSGLVGASSIVSLLVGSIFVQALQADVALAFVSLTLVGTACIVPLALRPPARVERTHVERRLPVSRGSGWRSAWVVFTIASLLLSWSTSTVNSYVVLFIEYVGDVAAADVANTSTRAVTAATLTAITASVLSGLLLRGRRSAAVTWAVAAVVVSGSVASFLAFPSPLGFLVSAIGLGAGFGMANGVELGLLLFLRHEPGRLGRDLGIFNAATSAPYVLVPTAATALLAANVGDGLRTMFVIACLVTIAGAAMTAGIAVTTRRRWTNSG